MYSKPRSQSTSRALTVTVLTGAALLRISLSALLEAVIELILPVPQVKASIWAQEGCDSIDRRGVMKDQPERSSRGGY